MFRVFSTFVILFTLLLFIVVVPAHAQSACPNNVTVEQGKTTLDKGQYQEAITAFSCVLETDPENPDAYIGRAEAYVLNGDWFLAFADYRSISLVVKSAPTWWERLQTPASQLIHNDPGSPAGRILRAHLYWYGDQDNSALEEYDLILLLDPSNLFALTFRGSSRLYLGKEGYAEDWARALELAPENPNIPFFIASTYRGVGELDKALFYANRVLEIDPKYAIGYHVRGRIHLAREEYQQAVDDFQQAVDLGLPPTTTVEELSYMGEANLHLNRLEEANANFEQAEAVMPGSPWVGLCAGYSYSDAGYPDKAASAYLDYVTRLEANKIQGETLTLNEPITVELDHSGWNEYSLPVELKKGQIVHFETNSINNNYTDPLIVLVSPDGTALAASDDQESPFSRNAVIRAFTVPDDGLYTLLVTSSLDGSKGGVEVRFTEG